MNEAEWVERIAMILRKRLRMSHVRVETGLRLTYGYEIFEYERYQPDARAISYQTDLSIVEDIKEDTWIPRVIIEAKIKSISTHDAITYSRKATDHRVVHPYLRYGIMLGMREKKPLPGRLYRHGADFDFMISFRKAKPHQTEEDAFLKLVRNEVNASRQLEKIIYENRRADRDRYTILHRRLELY